MCLAWFAEGKGRLVSNEVSIRVPITLTASI